MTVRLVVSFGGVVLVFLVLLTVAEIMIRKTGESSELTAHLAAGLSRAELAAKRAQEEIARVRASLLYQR